LGRISGCFRCNLCKFGGVLKALNINRNPVKIRAKRIGFSRKSRQSRNPRVRLAFKRSRRIASGRVIWERTYRWCSH
jgi:hypothetical protein